MEQIKRLLSKFSSSLMIKTIYVLSISVIYWYDLWDLSLLGTYACMYICKWFIITSYFIHKKHKQMDYSVTHSLFLSFPFPPPFLRFCLFSHFLFFFYFYLFLCFQSTPGKEDMIKFQFRPIKWNDYKFRNKLTVEVMNSKHFD